MYGSFDIARPAPDCSACATTNAPSLTITAGRCAEYTMCVGTYLIQLRPAFRLLWVSTLRTHGCHPKVKREVCVLTNHRSRCAFRGYICMQVVSYLGETTPPLSRTHCRCDITPSILHTACGRFLREACGHVKRRGTVQLTNVQRKSPPKVASKGKEKGKKRARICIAPLFYRFVLSSSAGGVVVAVVGCRTNVTASFE